MSKQVVAAGRSKGKVPLPQIERARELFAPHLPCEAADLRRVYLRLALQYHPDKRPQEERRAATDLFQAIAAAYEEVLQESTEPQDALSKRVKSPVAAAAELGELDELRRLLEERPERANEEDDIGVYPLMFAAAGGCIEAVEMLLEFGADLHAMNPIKWSSVFYATLGNHADMVRYLVKRGAKVTDHDLIIAAFTGNPSSFEALLELYEASPADMRTDESKKTLLHLAVEGLCFLKHSAERHAACVELALRWKVPVDVKEPRNMRTALQIFVADVRWRTRGFANSSAHLDVVEQLCMHGASVINEDATGCSALSTAADMGLARVREILLSYA